MSEYAPVRREVLVDGGPADAFEIFTARLGRWWPLEAGFGVYLDGTVALAGGRIIERSADGRQAVWGTVTRWDPPAGVAFSWHPGRDSARADQVDVTFTTAGERTLVSLTRSGPEVFGDLAAVRSGDSQGWPEALGRYAEFASRPGQDGDEQTWVALLHRPGPSAPKDGPVFDDPRFGEHVAFLNRMSEAGYLVAAGPLADEAGAGMTVLRLPGDGQEVLAAILATSDDGAVREGLLAVTVRPWRVAMTVVPPPARPAQMRQDHQP